MAFCANCGTQLNEGTKFCASCGTPAGGAAPAKPATEKVGNIRKCPACGAEVPAMSAICSSCGYEFSNVQVANSVQAFFAKLDAIDEQVFAQEAAKESQAPLGGAVGAMLGLGTYAKTMGGAGAGAKRKVALIEGFPIPNSKEDILEFVVLAVSRFKDVATAKLPFGAKMSAHFLTDEQVLDQAWKAKCEQAYNKAKLSFGSDKEAIARIEGILKEKRLSSKRGRFALSIEGQARPLWWQYRGRGCCFAKKIQRGLV